MPIQNIVILAKRKIFNDFSWIFAGSAISALFSLIFMKMIALYIDPDVYGRYSLHLQIILFVNTVFFTPFLQAFLKFYKSESSSENVYKFYNTILLFLFVIFSPLLLLFVKIYFNPPLFFYLFFVVFLYFTLFSGYLKNIFYIQRKQKHFSFATILTRFIPLVILLSAIIYFTNRDESLIWIAQSSGVTVAFFYLLIILKKDEPRYSLFKFYTKFDIYFKKLLKNNISYVLPLFMFGISSWIINVSDRYIIDYFLDETEVGIYSAGYGLGSQIMMLVGGVVLATVKPVMFDLFHKDPRKYFATKKKLYFIYIAGGLFMLAAIYLFSEFIGFAFLSEKYQNSFDIVVLISAAYFIVNLIYLTEVTFYVSGKTIYLFYAVAVGAISNIILNIFMIPRFGVTGAAVSTILSFIIQFLVLYVFYIKFKKVFIK